MDKNQGGRLKRHRHQLSSGSAWRPLRLEALEPRLALAAVLDGLVALYSGDGDAKDSVGGYDATTYGNISYVPGKYGLAFKLDGESFLDVNEAGSGIPLGATCTVTGWMRQDVAAKELLYQFTPEGFVGQNIQTDDPGKWFHFAFVEDENTGTDFFVDGNFVSHQAWPPGFGLHGFFNYELRIGGGALTWGSEPQGSFQGVLDEIAFYNRQLTDQEIYSLFQAGKNLPGNRAPTATGFSVTANLNAGTNITLSATDRDNDSLAYSVVDQPLHGTLSGAAPNLFYTPANGYTGPDSFSFTASDGKEDSNTATVSIDVKAEVQSIAELGSQSIDGIAQKLFPSVPPGGSPDLIFNTSNDNNALFLVQPTIDWTGRLTYTPALNAQAKASVTVFKDIPGGATETAVFVIQIVQRAPWQNDGEGEDVDDNGHVAPNDVILIIDYINGFGPGPIPDGGSDGPFDDPTGDNFIAPSDALMVINFINAMESGVLSGEPPSNHSPAFPSQTDAQRDLFALLAGDIASQPASRRRSV